MTGIVPKLTPGSGGIFDVKLNGKTVFSKHQSGRFSRNSKKLIHIDKKRLMKPLYLALSYDEEIGCIGVRSLIELMAKFKKNGTK